MQRGRIVGIESFGKIRVETLRDTEHGAICPEGSDCAKQAILRVQAFWKRKERIPLSIRRGNFNEKGSTDA